MFLHLKLETGKLKSLLGVFDDIMIIETTEREDGFRYTALLNRTTGEKIVTLSGRYRVFDFYEKRIY